MSRNHEKNNKNHEKNNKPLQGALLKWNWKDAFPYLGLICVIIFFQATTGRVFSSSNYKALLNDGFSIFIGAVGYIFVIAQGNLDFSIGGTMGLACTISAITARYSPKLAIFAALLTGVVIGSANGFFVAKLRLDSFIATMAFSYLLQGAIVILLGGGIIAAPMEMLDYNTPALKVTVLIITALLGVYLFNYTKFGRYNKAVGSAEAACVQTGINVARVKATGFIIMAVAASLVGYFSLLRTGTASANSSGRFLTNAFDAVLLGGVPIDGGAKTKFRGAIIGSLTMTILNNGMTLLGVGALMMQFVTGIIFILVIAITFNRRNLTVIK